MSTGPDAHLGTWLAVGVLIGLALALLLGILAVAVTRARRTAGSRGRHQPPAAVTPPKAGPGRPGHPFQLDDLPGFAERPPGWTAEPRPLTATPGDDRADARVPPPIDEPGQVHRPSRGPTEPGRAVTTAVAAAVLLLVAAVVVAWVGGGPVVSARSYDAAVATTPPATTGPTLSSPAAQPAPGPATGTAAAALAFDSVPLGEDGVAASATFAGVVLEQRAVGLTVTYPSVSVSTDGRRSLAHVRLPTFNCLTDGPPEDPLAAGCVSSLTEFADLSGPQLQVSRNGDRVDLVGLFATYTRSNGSAPAYTGRAYQLTASITADGPEHDGRTPAAGVVRIGLDSAPTIADAGVNVLQLPG